ncbi:MAG: hypothetical protein RLZZ214_4100 [Verrucomicrobiota bacterium]|jgi:hypothetical protein
MQVPLILDAAASNPCGKAHKDDVPCMSARLGP